MCRLTRRGVVAAILLLCAAQTFARKSSTRRLPNVYGFEKKDRGSRKETILLQYDETGDTSSSEQAFTQTELGVDCIRRHGGNGKGDGKRNSKSKKSKSSTYLCSEIGEIQGEESAPVTVSTSSPVLAPISVPSSAIADLPTAEISPTTVSTAPSITVQVAFTNLPTNPPSSLSPSAAISVSPSKENTFTESGQIAVAIPSAQPVVMMIPSVESTSLPTLDRPSNEKVPLTRPSSVPESTPTTLSSPSTAPQGRTFVPSPRPSLSISTESGVFPDDNALVRMCNSFLAGAAPTFGPKVLFQGNLVLLLDGTVPTQRILVDMYDILNNEVALALMGCSRLNKGGSGRQLQLVISGLRNIAFAVPTEDSAGVATISGSAYYTGEYPEGLFDVLRSVILNSAITSIPGLSGVGIDFEFEATNTDVASDEAPSRVATNNNISRESERERGEQRTGTFVGVVIAGMFAALSMILVVRASKRRREIGQQSKHHKLEDVLTDDESNGYSKSDHDTAPDAGENMWFANIIDDNDSGIITWGSHTPSIASHRYTSRYYPFRGAQFDEGHQCTDPDCIFCWEESQSRYSVSSVTPSSRFRKEYAVEDTVDL
ncbi:hypothetical protein FisN_23Lh223 [Fistulifera solaris]|uniref:SEA domain-containing protein n=1 Tax=Fistulifera solaris TaxID=1519565 RepID=A0A1Z5JS95_FISSO|nr:hypothetical protein FisN_23Lh223 [Fistulifera solaris]|eukprot:GAX16648.1 hypothetical protein FisN_23Lh223 [Fistulifera solaris]